jgi:O-antigen/teichoic acid export membrane protein
MAAGGQYFRMALQFALIAAISRLLSPTEIGVSVIGTGIITIALGLREFATSDFLIQLREVAQDDVRTSFTVIFLLTALITALMFVLAPWFAGLYGEERLAQFVRVAAVGGLVEAVSMPVTALLRRDMAFGKLTLINTTSATVTAVTAVLLVFAGFSYMSLAWATLAGAGATTAFSLYIRPNPAMFRPIFRSWGNIVNFGGYNGISYVINRTYEALPQLILGQMLPHSAVGLYNRANVTAAIPDQIVTTSVLSVAFPALAAEIRQGRGIKEPYLRALGLITVFYWPGQILLALFAYPVVSLLLGQQWLAVVPLLQVIAVASMAWFPVTLTSPVLLAVGARRDRVLADLVGRSTAAVVLSCTAYFAISRFGIMAMAASQLVSLPFQMVVALHFVRRHVRFCWRELWVALWPSAVVTAASAAGPTFVGTLSSSGFDLPIAVAALAAMLATTGWLVAALLVKHPVLLELRNASAAFAATSFVRRCLDLRERITI